ncbi:transposase [Microcoleus sp. FACHB-SPT15]|uniref:IS701 family transposase n=1 Tax=Microcoleus sp. FACHB-SPT15 TaxID=2692830 RepID=UPI00178561A4|nr:transposase [Microcoleus sp. FACHB-SPT15]MBD1805846.1 transposase [Microcoleus sp. FACHB-SPT15]
MRTPSKPSTAKCNLDTYTLFLLAEPKYAGCNRLSEILGDVSHDSINRFLLRERYEPKDLFDEIKQHIDLIDGTLSGDDTVIDKPYSDPALTELIGYFWSGKHHRVVKGIQLITLYYTDPSGQSVPVNYRIYDKQEGKSKNDYFREMIEELIAWGLKPKIVTGDTWYSSQENLKFLRNQKLGFLMGIAKNRKVSVQPGVYTQVQELLIPDNGLVVYLKNFGKVKVFRKTFKNEVERYYIMFLPCLEELEHLTRYDFKQMHSIHWGIECYHRAIKQLCGIERFMVRTTDALKTHFFCAIRAFTQLELMRTEQLIENWYELQRNLSLQIAREFILGHLKQRIGLNAY